MQLLFVHSDHLEFEAITEAGEDLAETEGVPMEGRMEDCVTVFASIEREDEADLDAVVQNGAAEVRDVAAQLNTRKVVLYPDAHLSDDLADPDSAEAVLRNLQAELDADFEVLRAPFGWYKAFEVASKGHPLSELSRHVTPEREETDDADSERAPSEWKLVFPDGETQNAAEAEDDDRVSDDLRAFVEAEVEGRTASETGNESDYPSHVELAREQELADYDELADDAEYGDADGLRWYPRGKLVRDALAEYVRDLAVEFGVMPVETAPSDDHEGCGRRLDVFRDLSLSADDLPRRIYDSTAHHEMHAVTRNLERAKEGLRAQAGLVQQTGEALGLDYVPAIRLTREFYDDNEAWVESLVSDLGEPALLEVRPERRRGWSVEIDFAAIDRAGRPIESATIGLDTESAERFDIAYSTGGADDSEESHHPPILHCSPFGSIESVLAALLERAAEQETPRLPTWLSPTQVRFVPVASEHVEYCDALVADLESGGVRADVDDRDETVGKRITIAETDWVPYYVVVGDREMEDEDDALKVNVRAEDDERGMRFEELRDAVLDDVGDLPKKKRYLPKHLSEHPSFTGR